ncbi:hypothetical protein D1BOALGB6SA_3072 [Olavius sp. associated proteobacterium Delta 1]|nr:hypothetical protein D1BOALGB6SA_3072 [Olavius sp. associated proteobacterium Delta 1]
MNVKIKKSLIISGSIAILFFFVSPLQAYVLQGRHVLDLMIEKLGPAESLFVSERLVFYRMAAAVNEQDAATGQNTLPAENTAGDDTPATLQVETDQEALELQTLEFEGTLRYVFSRAFRSDARSPNSERIHIAVGGRTLTIIDNNIVPDAANRFDLYKDVLLYRSREALAERLLQLGVDTSISSLGRFEGKIAFVLGAKYPDETVNQLWVDKDTLLPLRLIIRGVYGADNSDKVEIRYLIWWKIGEIQYPSKIEFYQDDNLVRLSQANSFEENAMFSEELFDIEHLKMVYPQAPLQPISPVAAEEPSEVQKTIEDFKRIFE